MRTTAASAQNPSARAALLGLLASLTLAHCAAPGASGPAAAPVRPGGPPPAADACVACHAGPVARERAQRSVHMPFREGGTCTTCHEPHGQKGALRLTAQPPELCTGCHGERRFAFAHAPGATGRTLCTACHLPHASARPALLRHDPDAECRGCHTPSAPRHGGYPVETTACTSCHSPHAAPGAHVLRSEVHAVAADCATCHEPPGSPKPFARSGAEPALCLACHPDREEELAKPVVHAPARAGCTSCHSPHASGQRALAVAPAGELCVRCHTAVGKRAAGPAAHAPAARGDCSACHLPHGGAEKALAREAGADLCLRCHREVRTWLGKPSVHAPLRTGCASCHDPHGSGQKKLLTATGSALCQGCHAAGKNAPPGASRVHPGGPKGECVTCHSPHASDRPRLVTAPAEQLCQGCHAGMRAAREGGRIHSPYAGESCDTCHTPHRAGARAGLAGVGPARPDPAGVCLQCHVGVRKTRSRSRSLHPPFLQGPCAACHDPHGSREPKLLARAPGTLCLGCHGDLAKRLADPKAVVHAPVQGGDCLACHRGHGSTEPALLTEPEGKLCAGCHDLASEPLTAKHGGYAVEAARCTGCHDPHVGGAKGIVAAEAHAPFGGGDCATCHADPTVPPGPAGRREPGLAACAGCHDFEAVLKAGRPHAPARDGACFECHAPHAAPASRPHLVGRGGLDLCLRCHPRERAALFAARPHAPFVRGQCRACHAPHGSGKPALLTAEGDALCAPCHDAASEKLAARHARLDLAKGCASCHAAHGGEKAAAPH